MTTPRCVLPAKTMDRGTRAGQARASHIAIAFLFSGMGLVRAPPACAALPWEAWTSPAQFAQLDPADIVVELSSRCPGGCRYDRSGIGPENPLENPYPWRWLYRDGEEVVLLDERGPGALTRIWMTTGDGVSRCIDPAIRVRFRLDGEATPSLDMPLAALFDGSIPPFTPPLVADRLGSSGGYVSQVPIAYVQSLRVSLLNAESGTSPCDPSNWRLLWYQFTVHRIAPGTKVERFSPSMEFPAWRAFLSAAGADPWSGMLAPQAFAGVLAPDTATTVATLAGGGWLRGLRLDVPVAARAHVALRIVVDGETAVDMPLVDYFATAATATLPARSALFGEDSGGTLYAWWPMPFAASAHVELVGSADLPMPIAIAGSFAVDPSPPPVAAGRYAALLEDTCVAEGDVLLHADRGAGKLVGISARYRADGVASRIYLEGDERAAIDDAITPAWYGTGVEDFYAGGFYFDQGAFAGPLAGATEVDPDGTATTAAYRIMPTDALVYSSALRLVQEAGLSPAQTLPMCIRHVVHRYRQARPLSVRVARFDVATPQAVDAHAHELPANATCSVHAGTYADEPPSARSAGVCRYASGTSRFTFQLPEAVSMLRLRRTFDGTGGTPGTTAGAPAAEVRIGGSPVGWFPPAASDPLRRWQEQEIVLGGAHGPGPLALEIVPQFSAHAAMHNESAWELRSSWIDTIHVDGFDPADSAVEAGR